jgi:GNAT superfamily N-acetyltransferase
MQCLPNHWMPISAALLTIRVPQMPCFQHGSRPNVIRAARIDDIDALREIERAAGRIFAEIGMGEIADDEPISEETLRGYRTSGRTWVAVDDYDTPIGYVVADVLDGNAHIEQVSVLPTNMRRGLGRELLDHVAIWASEQGMQAMTLTTFAYVPWNGPYYRRLGFEILAEDQIGPNLRDRRRHETDRGLDKWPRVCMSRALRA